MLQHGVPEHARSDKGAEMTARRVKQWLQTVGTQPLFIEPGSLWATRRSSIFRQVTARSHSSDWLDVPRWR
jgi:hypothetical protein